MARRHGVERDDQVLPLTNAPQRHEPLAVLRRLHRVRLVEHARRTRQPAHRFGDHLQRLRFVDPPRDHEHGVVGLVVLLVERGQPLDRHLFDVLFRADGRLAVVVPEVGRRRHALAQNGRRAVLSALELVAHDRHLGVQDRLGELHVDHAIGLESKRPLQVVVARREGLVVVGAVLRGRAVPAGAVRHQFLLDLPAVRGLDEIHVLEQMRHARLAIAFVPRPDQIGHVDRDLRLGRIGIQEHPQAVRVVVFGDAAHRRHLPDAGRQGLRQESRESTGEYHRGRHSRFASHGVSSPRG